MLGIRRSEQRGHARHGWLESRHTFSFADYWDPKAMGFRNLRVINEDRVRGGAGFPTHPHRDMEIVSYVLDGALEHQDSLGTGSVIRPGEIQRMTAGTGVRHSEYNAQADAPVHFLQIWILPERRGLTPSYEQVKMPEARHGAFVEIAGADPPPGAVRLHADARLLSTVLEPSHAADVELPQGRHGWLHVARGRVRVADGEQTVTLQGGDAAAFAGPATVRVEALDHDGGPAEVLFFELP